ncbi:MAG: hypothetical protein LBM17_03805 [Candidatus Accumulibacter sp.]|jgi:hypothetical protein|nr:hypothetical protein [Accumulibacter sp.]
MKKQRPQELGVFLTLFFVMFTIFCPLSKILILPIEHAEMLRLYPDLEWSGGWVFYDTAIKWASYVVVVQRTVAGYCLLFVRRWESIVLTIATLWLSDPCFTLAEMLLSWFLFGIETGKLFGYAGGDLIFDVSLASLWTAYFLQSRRVRTLYPFLPQYVPDAA